jgi:hypothetical protein
LLAGGTEPRDGPEEREEERVEGSGAGWRVRRERAGGGAERIDAVVEWEVDVEESVDGVGGGGGSELLRIGGRKEEGVLEDFFCFGSRAVSGGGVRSEEGGLGAEEGGWETDPFVKGGVESLLCDDDADADASFPSRRSMVGAGLELSLDPSPSASTKPSTIAGDEVGMLVLWLGVDPLPVAERFE